MPTPIETVAAFCTAFSEDYGRTAIRRFFTPETVWVNEGMSVTTGIDEAVALIEAQKKKIGGEYAHFDLLHVAADGNQVLTERRDWFTRADGSEIGAGMVMGIFEIEGNRIVAWRDYFDVRVSEKWNIR